MNLIKYSTLILILLFGIMPINLFSDDAEPGNFSLGSTSYISYETEIKQGDGIQGGAFKINRSYLTLNKSIYKGLGFRITLDAWQDNTGDMKARLKYIYANYLFDDISFITKPNIEFGIVHTPWLDFEEHVNYYRMQGTMFMERNGLFNSSDFGITTAGYLGGEMDADYKNNVNSKYAGRYGSFALGVYNGGGYHAEEFTQNKVLEGRLTLRPFPDIIPGLQFSYFGIFGKGNFDYGNDSIPNWRSNAVIVSYESQYFTVTGQYVNGNGNQKGTNVVNVYEAAKISGYSLFTEVKPNENWRVIARYDSFDPNTESVDNENQRYIIGVGYDFGRENILILDYDKSDLAEMIKLTMQVNF